MTPPSQLGANILITVCFFFFPSLRLSGSITSSVLMKVKYLLVLLYLQNSPLSIFLWSVIQSDECCLYILIMPDYGALANWVKLWVNLALCHDRISWWAGRVPVIPMCFLSRMLCCFCCMLLWFSFPFGERTVRLLNQWLVWCKWD